MSERIEIPEGVEQTTVEGFVAASADAVWDLWTTVGGLEQWWWPMFEDADYEVDARDDGLYRFRASSGGVGVQGRYLQLDEGKRMVFSWDWMAGYEDGERREDLVVVDFSELGDGTHVVVTLTGPLDELDTMREGWQDTMTRLEELLD